MNEIFLETEHLLLRRLQESDFADYAVYAADHEMSRMMGRPLMKTQADIRQNFHWLKDKEPRCYGIIEKASDHLIGNLSICTLPTSLSGIDCLHGKQGRTISFCICRKFQRKGYASEAVQSVCQELFEVEHLDFVQCGCFDFNTPSRRLQEQLGFIPLETINVGNVTIIEHILWKPKEFHLMLQPRLTKVEPIAPLKLRLNYETGEVKDVDVAPYATGAWYSELKNELYFRTVHLLPGGTGIEWNDGQDIAPHELYELSVAVH